MLMTESPYPVEERVCGTASIGPVRALPWRSTVCFKHGVFKDVKRLGAV